MAHLEVACRDDACRIGPAVRMPMTTLCLLGIAFLVSVIGFRVHDSDLPNIHRGQRPDTANNYRVIVQYDLAYTASAGPQQQAADEILTYPCQGSTGIVRQLSNETPNPVPGRDLAVNPLGSSVYIQLREGHTLAITSASMVNISTGVAVALRAPITSSNDPTRAV